MASPPLPLPNDNRVRACLDRVRGLHPRTIDLSLDRVQRLLRGLDRPETRLPAVIHIAGTNGKGSTLAFLRAMLEAAGHRVHAYTSPHLINVHESIRLAGAGQSAPVTDTLLAALLEECETANAGRPITVFEIVTVAAFLAFARTPADVVLLETGLGGRLDATNVVDRPAVAAITRISYDHTEFLGATLGQIAAEKAGIFRPGVPVVLAPQPAPDVDRALRAHAAALAAPILAWSVTPDDRGGFHFAGPVRSLDAPPPTLIGAHQIVNAGMAIACLEALPSLPVPDPAIRTGLGTVDWPARLQRLTRGPLPERLPPGWELWLDGGHNDSAGAVLGVQAAAWSLAPTPRPLSLVFGMLATKDPRAFLTPLADHVHRLRAVPIPSQTDALSPSAAAAAALAVGIADALPAHTPLDAIETLMAAADRPGRILICGSLYLAGDILRENG